jgi:hypothetical protein
MCSVSTTTWLITAETGNAQPTEVVRGQKTRSRKKHLAHATVQSLGAVSRPMEVRLAATSSKTMFTVVGKSGKRRQQDPPAGGVRSGGKIRFRSLDRFDSCGRGVSSARTIPALMAGIQKSAQLFTGTARPTGNAGITSIESAGSPNPGGCGPP